MQLINDLFVDIQDSIASMCGKFSNVQNCCPNIQTTISKFLPNGLHKLNFRNFKLKKHCSSSTLPTMKTVPNWTSFRYSRIICNRTCEELMFFHNHVKRFSEKDEAQTTTKLLFIATLNNPYCRSRVEGHNIFAAHTTMFLGLTLLLSVLRHRQQCCFETSICFGNHTPAPYIQYCG